MVLCACSRPPTPTPAAVATTTTPDASAPEQPVATVAKPEPVTAPEPEPTCEPAPGVSLFVSPATPVAGQPLRIMALSDKPLTGALAIDGVTSATRRGGPPYFWTVETTAGSSTKATFTQKACADGAVTQAVSVARAANPNLSTGSAIWPTRASWNHNFENVYSAWVEALFDAADDEMPSWPALSEVLRDPKRNFLLDHLGAKEDTGKEAPFIRPDCADLPYFLRAYFAWKLRLPMGVAECNRGGGGAPPTCHGLITNEDAEPAGDTPVQTFGTFLRTTLANKAHSGSARTAFDDENGDYYPVKLSWESLRPGTTYADPYGHVLVVAKRLPQTATRGGVLYAVDGQPDGTVARKRFWRGNFLYAHARELGGPGFKHFRPLVKRKGALTRMTDAMIAASPDYHDVDRAPGDLDSEAFYDAMDDVLSPSPLDPERAMLQTIDALEEQVRTRVQSVDNGRKWLAKGQGLAPMPEGTSIFETTGVWEDFATPSRDMRLLIAIDVVRGFPSRVQRRPDHFAKAAEGTSLDATLERELKSRSVKYTRTDGSPFELTLTEVLARTPAFEMTYNPNDCVETRWAAPAGSDEASTCRAHAPGDQLARMSTYRSWFHDRRRPARR